MARKALTEAERAALDARDRELTRRFIARDPDAEREMVVRLDQLGYLVAHRLWPRLAAHWEEFRGAMYEVLARYRDEGRLREGESLYFLAQRLMKQAGRKAGAEWAKEAGALRIDDPRALAEPRQPGKPTVTVEAAASITAAKRVPSPEQALERKEAVAGLGAAAERLLPGDRATFEGAVAVAQNEADSLAEALLVTPPAARQRMQRLRQAFAAYAVATGAMDMLGRLGAAGRAAAKLAAESPLLARLLAGAKEPAAVPAAGAAAPGADHVIDALPDYLSEALPAAEALRTERHLNACADCRAALAALRGADAALEAYLTLPPPPLDVEAALAILRGARPTGRAKGGASRIAAAAALALFLAWIAFRFLSPAPPPPKPARPRPAALVPAKPEPLLMAPVPEPEPDAGKRR